MDPYKSGMFKSNPYCAKTDVEGRLAVVLRGRYEERGLTLIAQPSRCVQAGEIHELIACDEEGISPGSKANKIAYLGFAEITRGGVILSGDALCCGGNLIGTIAGFDETHMPNHLNIVVNCGERKTGEELGLELDSSVLFKQVKESN